MNMNAQHETKNWREIALDLANFLHLRNTDRAAYLSWPMFEWCVGRWQTETGMQFIALPAANCSDMESFLREILK